MEIYEDTLFFDVLQIQECCGRRQFKMENVTAFTMFSVENTTFNVIQNVTLNTSTDQLIITAKRFITMSNASTVLNVMRILFGLAAIGGNSLIILCVIQYRSLRTKTNMLIANFAVADLLSGCASEFSSVMTFLFCTGTLTISLVISKARSMMSSLPFLVNNLAILLIAFERFICIRFALRYKAIGTSHGVAFVLILTWVACGAICTSMELLKSANLLVSLICGIGIVLFYSYMTYVTSPSSWLL